MRSQVAKLAKAKGFEKPADLQWAARVSWPTAKQVWKDDFDLSKTWGDTLHKLAAALDCHIEDLYIYETDKEKAT